MKDIVDHQLGISHHRVFSSSVARASVPGYGGAGVQSHLGLGIFPNSQLMMHISSMYFSHYLLRSLHRYFRKKSQMFSKIFNCKYFFDMYVLKGQSFVYRLSIIYIIICNKIRKVIL